MLQDLYQFFTFHSYRNLVYMDHDLIVKKSSKIKVKRVIDNTAIADSRVIAFGKLPLLDWLNQPFGR